MLAHEGRLEMFQVVGWIKRKRSKLTTPIGGGGKPVKLTAKAFDTMFGKKPRKAKAVSR